MSFFLTDLNRWFETWLNKIAIRCNGNCHAHLLKDDDAEGAFFSSSRKNDVVPLAKGWVRERSASPETNQKWRVEHEHLPTASTADSVATGGDG